MRMISDSKYLYKNFFEKWEIELKALEYELLNPNYCDTSYLKKILWVVVIYVIIGILILIIGIIFIWIIEIWVWVDRIILIFILDIWIWAFLKELIFL